MKISKQLFERFDSAIKETISELGGDTVKQHRQNVAFVDSQFNSFCWSIYRVANKRQGLALSDEAYQKEGLYDAHILTALKAILADYK